MRSITVIVLHACATQAYHEDHPSMDNMVKQLSDRALQATQPTDRSVLDGMTLQKPGHTAMSPSRTTYPLAIPRSSPLSAKRGKLSGFSSVAHTQRGLPAAGAISNKAPTWDEKRAPPGGASYKDWPVAYMSLLDKGLKVVSPEEALTMMEKKDAVLADVRQAVSIWDSMNMGPFQSGTLATYKSGTAEGSVNVPLFRQIQGTSLFDILKRLNAYMFIIEPTERNPDFVDMALEKLPKNKPIILACNRGGLLDGRDLPKAKLNVPMRYTSSLKAAFELYRAGFKDLYLLDGGIKRWEDEGLPWNESPI
eukprot:gnl/MRDRNA2_/MRDRNA2_107577_c0_seq1.p1 gnl/MRDRNA2_/MRDRNA2_107577_c0~~gnl/MRDRNA2_/MRDRNA2_107577_c0_seq1.p1  ORF type:complete len:308 (-),score=54.90 gnl/MRDRNA2_/MRDRNA2_107577_c0_seq1:181-1104(-)